MVLFVNVNIGQYVEVKHRNHIVCGIVRYKGHLNGERGEWIGIELEYPLAQHNGCWRGRQYFKCRANCGLFTHASCVRFRKSGRKLRDSYHKVDDCSFVDETLFCSSSSRNLSTCYSVSKQYVERAKTAFEYGPSGGVLLREERYPLSHSIGRTVPAATMLTQLKSNEMSYTTRPTHCEYADELDEFIPRSSSIPHYTMPHEALKRQMKRGGWEEFGLHRPRFISV